MTQLLFLRIHTEKKKKRKEKKEKGIMTQLISQLFLKVVKMMCKAKLIKEIKISN